MTNTKLSLPDDIDTEFCDIMVAWDALEKAQGRHPVVDFNLIEWTTNRTYSSLDQVKTDLETITKNTPNNAPWFKRRVNSLLWYIRDIQSGAALEQNEYFKNTMGFNLTPVLDREIKTYQEKLFALTDQLGIARDDIYYGLKRCDKEIQLDEVPTALNELMDREIKQVEAITGHKSNFEYDVKIVDIKSAMRGRITGKGRKFLVEYNRHVMKTFGTQNLKQTARHELLGHGVQLALWVDKVENGEMPKSNGITTTQTQELVLMEAVAETIPMVIPDNDIVYKATIAYNELRRRVAINTHCILFNRGVEMAGDYHRKILPDYPEDILNLTMKQVSTDSMYRFYAPIYGPANRMFALMRQKMGNENFKAFLGEAYNSWLDVPMLNNLVKEYDGTTECLLHTGKLKTPAQLNGRSKPKAP